MEKKRFFTTRMIAVTGVLTAIEVILQLIGNHIGTININLSLIPICLGAILYGPFVGGFLGLVCGAIVIASPSTSYYFMPVDPLGTIITCLVKTTVAGVVAGFVMKLFKEHKLAGAITISILVPVINTGIFAIFVEIFFRKMLEDIVTGGLFSNTTAALFMGMIGINFIIEVMSTPILVPSIYKIVESQSKNKSIE